MRNFPVVEYHHTIQGEGSHAGKPMLFVRLAGCPVGVYRNGPSAHSTCTNAMGQEFTCDTDYRKGTPTDVLEIVLAKKVNCVCLTGGEPLLIPEVGDLVYALVALGVEVHIETSGVLDIYKRLHKVLDNPELEPMLWVTCSPKLGYLEQNAAFISEFKFVVQPHDLNSLDVVGKMDSITEQNRNALVYLQCVGTDDAIGKPEDQQKLVEFLLQRRNHWRLSVQQHKVLALP